MNVFLLFFRFGVKVGILSSAVYYSKQAGVWEDSSRTYQLSKCLIAFLKPYVKPAFRKVENELPFKVCVHDRSELLLSIIH